MAMTAQKEVIVERRYVRELIDEAGLLSEEIKAKQERLEYLKQEIIQSGLRPGKSEGSDYEVTYSSFPKWSEIDTVAVFQLLRRTPAVFLRVVSVSAERLGNAIGQDNLVKYRSVAGQVDRLTFKHKNL